MFNRPANLKPTLLTEAISYVVYATSPEAPWRLPSIFYVMYTCISLCRENLKPVT